ncbi:MAG: DUF1737 domain-containing protein [Sphingobium sp.]
MKLYRLLTGPDNSAFCARIERMLNKGWELHGPPSLTFNGETVIAAQAIVREAEGDYAGFVSLKDMYPDD